MTEPASLVAIDGPVASGKTVVGRALATHLGWGLFDTGIMYRALTWLAFRERVELDDEVGLEALAHDAEIELKRGDDAANPDVQVMIEGENVTEHLRASDVEAAVSTVAAVAGVRRELVKLQQRATVAGEYVVVGRDIGTVVLPNAPVKIFLTASDEVRARRRSEERGDVGSGREQEVLAQTRRRDEHDRNRSVSPLVAAADAIELDTSDLTLAQAIDQVCAIVQERLPHLAHLAHLAHSAHSAHSATAR